MNAELISVLLNSKELYSCLVILGIAGFVQGVFGLGFAMIATPLLALFLDYRSAVFLAAVPLFVIAISFFAIKRKRAWVEPLSTRIAPGIIAGSFLGVLLQAVMPQRASLVLLAMLLVFSALLPILLRHRKRMPEGRLNIAAPLLGACAGVTETSLNVGAPFIMLLGALARLSWFQLAVALNVCFAVGKTIQLTLLSIAAPVPVSGTYLVSGVIVSQCAYLWGSRFTGRFSEQSFRRAMGIFQCVMAIALLRQAFG